MNSRGRFAAKVAAGAAASLTALIVVAPLLTGGKEAVAPAVAAESTIVDVKGAVSYVQFDVQTSEAETGSFVVEVHPGACQEGVVGAPPDEYHIIHGQQQYCVYCCAVMVAVVVVAGGGRCLSPSEVNMARFSATPRLSAFSSSLAHFFPFYCPLPSDRPPPLTRHALPFSAHATYRCRCRYRFRNR